VLEEEALNKKGGRVLNLELLKGIIKNCLVVETLSC